VREESRTTISPWQRLQQAHDVAFQRGAGSKRRQASRNLHGLIAIDAVGDGIIFNMPGDRRSCYHQFGTALGVANKITADIRAGAIAGFARHGSNGRGEGGFAGFCFFLARKHPKAAARIVEKLLPLTVNGTGVGGSHISAVNIVSIPHGHFLDAAGIEKYRAPATLLEHEAQLELPAGNSDQPEPEPSQVEASPGDVACEPTVVERWSEPEPAPEPDPIMQHALAMGYVPLPPRPRRDY
jgi:hypothetical protein